VIDADVFCSSRLCQLPGLLFGCIDSCCRSDLQIVKNLCAISKMHTDTFTTGRGYDYFMLLAHGAHNGAQRIRNIALFWKNRRGF